jgi:hypothetical protein
MTYQDKFVAEIKSSGKILRVKDDTVFLPFGSEYSLLLKNLNTRRASVNIEIDGQDVLDNKSLIIEPNKTTELMGFLRGATATNRFKFIQKTKQIQDHRGDKLEDGLVRVEFAFEKPYEPWIVKTIQEVHHKYEPPFTYTYFSTPDWSYQSDETSGGKNVMRGMGEVQSYNCSIDPVGVVEDSLDQPQADEGITVKGQEINQDFRYASMGTLEEAKVIVLKLRGLISHGVSVSQPLTVQSKLTCSSCGTKSKSSAKYCHKCGTFLE